jgi:hypothetical protein
MRLTKKQFRKIIAEAISELKEVSKVGMSATASFVPSPQQQEAMRAQMVQEFMDIRVPGIPGAIYSQMEAEAMADAKIAELNAPASGAGMSRHYGVPRTEVGMMSEGKLDRKALRQMILQEMRMAPTHAGAIEMMQANPDETVMFEPGEEVPSAEAIADAVEKVQDQGLLTKIYNMIKSITKPIEPDEAFEYARQQRENPTGINKFLGGGAVDPALGDLGTLSETLSEGFEPGGYRAEGDRKLNEVSVGVGRWNLLAGTDEK